MGTPTTGSCTQVQHISNGPAATTYICRYTCIIKRRIHVCTTIIIILKDDSLDTSSVGATRTVVLKLLEGLEGRGHHVYTDNYYNSPALFSDL